jgi:four helix bundle protein
MITKLEDFKVYNLSMILGEEVWSIVNTWGYFEKDSIGRQLVKSTDSIAANLLEGLGRYHIKDIKNFSYYSRGYLFETKTWLVKSFNRKLITKELHDKFISDIDQIGRMLNAYINSLGKINESANT